MSLRTSPGESAYSSIQLLDKETRRQPRDLSFTGEPCKPDPIMVSKVRLTFIGYLRYLRERVGGRSARPRHCCSSLNQLHRWIQVFVPLGPPQPGFGSIGGDAFKPQSGACRCRYHYEPIVRCTAGAKACTTMSKTCCRALPSGLLHAVRRLPCCLLP